MAGNENSGRPGGNPEIAKHGFKKKGDEPLSKGLYLRLTPSMHQALKEKGRQTQDFIREAIADKLESEEE